MLSLAEVIESAVIGFCLPLLCIYVSRIFRKTPSPNGRRTGTGLTFQRALTLARNAGFKSRNEGCFQEWLEANHLNDRSDLIQLRLREAYFEGVDAADNAAPNAVTRRKIYHDLHDVIPANGYCIRPFWEHKGYRVYSAESEGLKGFKTNADNGESLFDSVEDAKRFIADEVKQKGTA